MFIYEYLDLCVAGPKLRTIHVEWKGPACYPAELEKGSEIQRWGDGFLEGLLPPNAMH